MQRGCPSPHTVPIRRIYYEKWDVKCMKRLDHLLFLIVIYILFLIPLSAIWYTALHILFPELVFAIPLAVSNSAFLVWTAFPPGRILRRLHDNDEDE
jgi:hypothetical protein